MPKPVKALLIAVLVLIGLGFIAVGVGLATGKLRIIEQLSSGGYAE